MLKRALDYGRARAGVNREIGLLSPVLSTP
jgi:hypothetical protein